MSSSSTSNKNCSEEATKTGQGDDGNPSYGSNGRKLTPLPITTPNAKPGQNQAAVHKLSTTLEEEDELDIEVSNENRNQTIQQNLPKNSISSASLITSAPTGSSPNTNENGNT